MIDCINGGSVTGLPKAADRPVFLNPAQATTVTSPPTVSAKSLDP